MKIHRQSVLTFICSLLVFSLVGSLVGCGGSATNTNTTVESGSEDEDKAEFGKKWGFIDWKGHVIVEPKYQNARSFSDGLAAVKRDGMWGFIDSTGNEVIEPKFFNVGSYVDGIVPFRNNAGKWGYMDRETKPIIEPKFDDGRNFSDRKSVV